ncbi:MAG TPA: ABC transporter substrate-binding protein [Chloroflexota bacterium]|nr:ABC transporter substrate-binding protein [Chloroflexota bacterium]
MKLAARVMLIPAILALAGCGASGSPAGGSPAAVGGAAPGSASVAATSALAGSSPASASSAAKPAASGAVTVKVGGLGGVPDRFLWVGQDKGYYAQQGLNLDVTAFKSFSEMVPLLATGKLDVGAGGLSPGLFNALLSGISMKVVSDASLVSEPPAGHHMSYGLVVRSDLKDQVKTVADMKGRAIGVNGTQGIGDVQLDAILHTGGLSNADVNVQAIPFPDAYAALANKKLDGALELEPFITLGLQQNVAFPLQDLAKALPNFPSQWVFYSTEFIKSEPDAGKRFLVAYTQAQRLDEDAFFKNKNHDEVVQMFINHTQAKDPKSYDDQTQTDNEVNANVNIQALQYDQDYFVAHGWQKSKLDVNAVVDASFGDYVRQTLGKYQ